MKLTLKELKAGQVIKEGNVAIKLTNGVFMVQSYTLNWESFESYKEAKKDYKEQIEIAESLNLQ